MNRTYITELMDLETLGVEPVREPKEPALDMMGYGNPEPYKRHDSRLRYAKVGGGNIMPQNDSGRQAQDNYHVTLREPEFEPFKNDVDCPEPTCLGVYNHASDCRVCGKLYTNNHIPYILTIILLAALSVYLFKKAYIDT